MTKLKDEAKSLRSDLESVLAILGELSNNWNPNGQDMAVKAAVVGFRELTGQVPDSGDTSDATEVKQEEGAEAEGVEGEFITDDDDEAPEAEPLLYALKNPDGAISEWELNHLLREDLEGLLQKDTESTAADDDDENSLRECPHVPALTAATEADAQCTSSRSTFRTACSSTMTRCAWGSWTS